MIGGRSFSPGVAAFLLGLASSSLAAAPAHAQDRPSPRQIDPDRFAPMPRDAATILPPRANAPVAPGSQAKPTPPAPAPIVMPSLEHPFGACDAGARDWLTCLGATAQLSDRAVAEAEARLVAGLAARPRLNPVMRATISKALAGADDAWRALRERECADLALIERGLTGVYYEVRLVCHIRRNLERAEALTSRYSGEP